MTGFCGFEPGRSSPRSEMESSKEYGSRLLSVLNSSVDKASELYQSTPDPLFSVLQMRFTSAETVWGGGITVASTNPM